MLSFIRDQFNADRSHSLRIGAMHCHAPATRKSAHAYAMTRIFRLTRYCRLPKLGYYRLGNFYLAIYIIFDIMTTQYSIRFYSKRIESGLLAMPSGMLAKFIRYAEKMEIYGPDLGMPHTKAMGKGLFELRIQAIEGTARVFYCSIKYREIVILHHFIKKTRNTPKAELEIARIRQQDSNR